MIDVALYISGEIKTRNMKKFIYLSLISIFCSTCTNAQNDILIRKCSSMELEPNKCGYMNSSGKMIIPFGKYTFCYTEMFDKMAIVSVKGKPGFFAINRKEIFLFEVLTYDNGPDEFNEGLIRIKKNGKIGFANEKGEILINPQFDAAMPFSKGYAAICIGGINEKQGEYIVRNNGKWGLIDKSGRFILKPVYEDLKNFEGKIEVKENKIWKPINFN
jgi:hypothetical protein